MSDVQDLLRVYLDPSEIGKDGYPIRWHKPLYAIGTNIMGERTRIIGAGVEEPAIKDLVREQAGNRCVRCGHPYQKGMGEWSPCDAVCTHRGPIQTYDSAPVWEPGKGHTHYSEPPTLRDEFVLDYVGNGVFTEAQWRILTVHHLNGIKHDCRWWNLVSLCQRCHLTIQGKVYMERRWHREHTEWFKPYVAGYYAWSFLGEELTREQTIDRLDELLALEDIQLELS